MPQRAGALAVIDSAASSGVTKLLAGTDVLLSPSGGTGSVTVTADARSVFNALNHGLVPNSTAAAAANTAALNALILAVDGDIFFDQPYYFGSAIQMLNKEATLIGPDAPTLGALLCGPGYTDAQLVRNWQASDYQTPIGPRTVSVTHGSNVVSDVGAAAAGIVAGMSVVPGQGFPVGSFVGVVSTDSYTVLQGPGGSTIAGYGGASNPTLAFTVGETNTFYAPVNVANVNNYVVIKNLRLSANGNSNLTLLARTRQNERSLIENVIYSANGSGSGLVGRADFGPEVGLYVCRGEIQYNSTTGPNPSYDIGILVDGLNGGKVAQTGQFSYADGCYLEDFVSAPSGSAIPAYSDSAIKIIGLSYADLRKIHHEGFPAVTDTTAFTDGVTNSTTSVTSNQFALSLLGGHIVGRTITDDIASPGSGDIPAGTTVASVILPNTIVLSQAATGGHSGLTLTLGSDTAMFRFMDCDTVNVDGSILALGGGHGPRSCRGFRSTASGITNAFDACAPMKLANIRNFSNGVGGGADQWSPGADLIEDAGGGSFSAYPFSSSFDPRFINYYDKSIFSYDNTGAMTPTTRLPFSGTQTLLLQAAATNFQGAASPAAQLITLTGVTAGDMLVLYFATHGSASITAGTPVTTVGTTGTWTQVNAKAATNVESEWWYAVAASSGTITISVTPSGSALVGLWLGELCSGSPGVTPSVPTSGQTDTANNTAVAYTTMTVATKRSWAAVGGNTTDGAMVPATGLGIFDNGPTQGGQIRAGLTYGQANANVPGATGWTQNAAFWVSAGIVVAP